MPISDDIYDNSLILSYLIFDHSKVERADGCQLIFDETALQRAALEKWKYLNPDATKISDSKIVKFENFTDLRDQSRDNGTLGRDNYKNSFQNSRRTEF